MATWYFRLLDDNNTVRIINATKGIQLYLPIGSFLVQKEYDIKKDGSNIRRDYYEPNDIITEKDFFSLRMLIDKHITYEIKYEDVAEPAYVGNKDTLLDTLSQLLNGRPISAPSPTTPGLLGGQVRTITSLITTNTKNLVNTILGAIGLN